MIDNDDDPELRLAMELSKKSFEDEEQRRRASGISPDLISFESIEEREQRRKVTEIQNLLALQKKSPLQLTVFPLDHFHASHVHTTLDKTNQMPVLTLDHGLPPPIPPRMKSVVISPPRPHNTAAGPSGLSSPRTPVAWRPQQYSSAYTTIDRWKNRETMPNYIHQENTEISRGNDLYVPYMMLASPGKTEGDLIDLATPADEVEKATIEQIRRDFDPLYCSSADVMPQPLSSLERTKSLRTENLDVHASRPSAIKTIPKSAVKRGTSVDSIQQVNRHDSLNIEAIHIVKYHPDIAHQINKLRQRTRIHAPISSHFFNSPTVDYMITAAYSVKVVVYKDHTWLRSGEQQRSMTCETGATIEMILTEVLAFFCDEFEMQKGISVESYGLKVYGLDEFLPNESVLGHNLYVGTCLLFGRDVKLEVGRRIPLKTGIALGESDYRIVKTQLASPSILDEEDIQNVLAHLGEEMRRFEIDALENNQLSVSTTSNKVRQFMKMLCQMMNRIEPANFHQHLQRYLTAGREDQLKSTRNDLIASIHLMITTYCKSTRSEYTVLPLRTPPSETRNVYNVSEKMRILVNSLHGLSEGWLRDYQQFYVTVQLYYGTQRIDGHERVIPKEVDNDAFFPYVSMSLYAEFNTEIRQCPRETKIMFLLTGIRKEESDQGISEKQPEHLAVASIELFDHDSIMRQGQLYVPLSAISGQALQPWGPHPLITSERDPVLLVSLPTYHYNVQFPAVTITSQIKHCDFHTLDSDQQEYLMDLVETFEPEKLSAEDRESLWQKRFYLMHIPEALPLVLASVPLWEYGFLSNIYPLLDEWVPLNPVQAVVLLLPQYPDVHVRTKALDWIRRASSDFVFNFLPQLVEALRFESYEHSSLGVLLLTLSNRDRRFAFEIYWQLQQRIDHCPYKDLSANTAAYVQRCQLLQNELLDRHESDSLRQEICSQHRLLNILDDVQREVKEDDRVEFLRERLGDLDSNLLLTNVRLPIMPSFLCSGIKVAECNIFNSNAKPLKIVFRGINTDYSVILKSGDDMRQDALVLHMVRVMNDVWLSENLDLKMVTFRCMPIGFKRGIAELVGDCATLCEIQKAQGVAGVFKDDVLCKWLERYNPTEFLYKVALDNFQRSCAGWCVATYVLGIGDRHNDNILVTTMGHVFHIDFGKYMGDWQMAAGFKRDRVPFVFTKEMFFVINLGSQSSGESYQTFIDYCCRSFNYLRKSHSVLTNLIKIMACSDIPGINVESLHFVEKNLMLDLSETDATIQFTQLIQCSLNSAFPRLNFFVHTIAQMMSGSSSVRPAQENNRLSFMPHVYTRDLDGKIKRVRIVGFAKYNLPNKVYLYKIEVERENEAVRTTIYRSFHELKELYIKLRLRFPTVSLPALTRGNTLRDNVRLVAERRMCDIQVFLMNLFLLEDEICHCDLVYTFFHIMLRDSNLENALVDESPLRDINECQVFLRMQLNMSKKCLSIFVRHARHLPMVNGQMPDSYVKTYIKPSANSNTKRKTQVCKSSQNPTFNSELSYDLRALSDMSNYLATHGLDISVWNDGGLKKDNAKLFSTFIPLLQLVRSEPDRKGIKVVEGWFTMRSG